MVAVRLPVAGTLWLMSPSLSNLFAVAEEHTRELPMPPYAIGALAFCSFLALLGILWGFRGSAQKLAAGHGAHGSEHQHDGHADHQGSHH
jgi:hypothetical protein